MADAHANFATSLVATAPSPATSGTSLVVTAGEGTRFPAVSFNAVICPAATIPTSANAEVVRVTTISTDTFTITRTQESSSARTVVVGDRIFAAVTAKTLTDVETDYTNLLATYKPYRTWQDNQIAAGVTAGTFVATLASNSVIAVAGVNSGMGAFYIDTTELSISGRTTKVRIKAGVRTNAVDPGTTIVTAHLYPVATWGGASTATPTIATVGASVVSIEIVNNPAASTTYTVASADVTVPATGYYTMAFVTTQTIAANAPIQVMSGLDFRHV